LVDMPAEPDKVVHEESPEEARPTGSSEALPMSIPGSSTEIAEEIAEVGVEGTPADPRSGPGMYTVELVIGFVALVAIAGVAALMLGWLTGLAILAIGIVGMVFNPVVPATILRARDRKDVAEHHLDEARLHAHQRK